MIQIENILKFLAKLKGKQFHGKITLSLEKGEVITLKVEETLKDKDLI